MSVSHGRRFIIHGVVSGVVLFFAGCDPGESSRGENGAAAPLSPPMNTRQIAFLGLETEVANSWTERQAASNMRLIQFDVEPEGIAEVIVYYFGAGQGGSPQANIDRWRNQFRPVDGKPVEALVNTMQTNGDLAVTWVELSGDYARGVGMGPVGEYRPDQMLIAAITETPHGNLYIQFHGDRERVMRHREEFTEFVMNIRNRDAAVQ